MEPIPSTSQCLLAHLFSAWLHPVSGLCLLLGLKCGVRAKTSRSSKVCVLPLGIHRTLGLEDGLATDGDDLGPRQKRSGSNKVKPRPPPGWHQLREKPEKNGSSRGPGCPWGWEGPLTCAPHSQAQTPHEFRAFSAPSVFKIPASPLAGLGVHL